MTVFKIFIDLEWLNLVWSVLHYLYAANKSKLLKNVKINKEDKKFLISKEDLIKETESRNVSQSSSKTKTSAKEKEQNA